MPTILVTATVTDAGGHSASASASATIGGPWVPPAASASWGQPTAPREVVTTSGNITFAGDDVVLENKDYPNARLSFTGKRPRVRNVRVQGGTPPTSGGIGLIQTTNANVQDAVFEDVHLEPRIPSPYWNGFVGHDATFRRVRVKNCQDGFQVKNASLPAGSMVNFTCEDFWVSDMIWWTASGPGDVHPSDINTHPDCFQLMQHGNYRIRRGIADSHYAKQVGHWKTTTLTEPYTTVPLNSLPDGGPWRAIPDRNLLTGSPLVNGITSTEANGRYSVDDQSCFMVGSEQDKPTFDVLIEDVLCMGGVFAINVGGNHPLAATPDFGTLRRVVFTRDQGSRPSEQFTSTIRFDGSGWAADQVTVENCTYEDGAPILVRGLV